MKTFIGAVLTLGSYQMVTIDEKNIGEYDYAFEVNYQETGVRTNCVGITTFKYTIGGFDMKLFYKGVLGDLKINGWSFPGSFNGTYEDKGNYGWIRCVSISILDPEGNSESVSIGDCNGFGPNLPSVALNYLNIVFEYCLYKNINDHKLATRPQSRYLLQSPSLSPKELLEQISILQKISESIKNLDNCDDIPEHVKEEARQKYQSLLTQIKDSKDFEKIIDKLLGNTPNNSLIENI